MFKGLSNLQAGIIQKLAGVLLISLAIYVGDISFMVIAIPGGLGMVVTKKRFI